MSALPLPSGTGVLNTDLNPMLLGWIDFLWFGSTLAYVSADAPTYVFSVNADVTAVIEPGMRVKLTQTTDKFFIVTAVGAYAAGVTPITVYGGTDYTLANAAITAGSFSTHKKPYGFNTSPAKWIQELVDTSIHSQATPGANTWYNPGSLSLSVPIGAWVLEWDSPMGIGIGSAGLAAVVGTLSTTNNGESNPKLSSGATLYTSAATVAVPMGGRGPIAVASKTSYFLNIATLTAAMSSISLGYGADSVIRATCAYL